MAPKSLHYGPSEHLKKGSYSGNERLPVDFLPGCLHGVTLELIELCDTCFYLGLVLEDRLEHLLEVAFLLLDTGARCQKSSRKYARRSTHPSIICTAFGLIFLFMPFC